MKENIKKAVEEVAKKYVDLFNSQPFQGTKFSWQEYPVTIGASHINDAIFTGCFGHVSDKVIAEIREYAEQFTIQYIKELGLK